VVPGQDLVEDDLIDGGHHAYPDEAADADGSAVVTGQDSEPPLRVSLMV
jgi:hypothetical protein